MMYSEICEVRAKGRYLEWIHSSFNAYQMINNRISQAKYFRIRSTKRQIVCPNSTQDLYFLGIACFGNGLYALLGMRMIGIQR